MTEIMDSSHFGKRNTSAEDLSQTDVLSQSKESSCTAGGKTFDRPKMSIPGYEILEDIGHGSMGVVYKARDLHLNRPVAVKVLALSGEDNAKTLQRFHREMQICARLSHPNIVSIYDAGMVGDLCYLVMEHVLGIDLQRWVESFGPLPIPKACDFLRQAALGLQHLHEQGLIHRDIKPANLIVTGDGWRVAGEEGRGADDEHGDTATDSSAPATRHAPPATVKILDLGLARFTAFGEDSGSFLTQEGIVMGTPDFIAPEQVEQPRAADIRADLYSLGCTFYFALTGQVPFPGHNVLEKLDRHRWGRPRLLERLRDDVPRKFAGVIRKLMAKRPEERFQTPAEMIAALDASTSASPPPPVPPPAAAPAASAPPLSESPEQSGATKAEALWDNTLLLTQRNLDAEFEQMKLRLADRLEHNALPEALDLVNAMALLKPDDSVTWKARAVLDEQRALLEPVGECCQLTGHEDWVNSVAFSPDGATAISASRDKTVRFWDLANSRSLYSFIGHEDSVKSAIFSPDGTKVLSASKDKTVRLWDLAQGREIRCYRRHEDAVNCIAFTPDGRGFLSAGDDRTIRLWDAESGHCLGCFTGHSATVKSVAVSPDGRRAVSGSWDHSVRFWNLENGQETHRFEESMNWFAGVTFSPNGRHVLFGGSDNVVYLMDVDRVEVIRRFEGHGNWVTSVAFSPDGRRAVSGSHDHSLRLWNLEKGQELYRFDGHTSWINSVAFSPDGRHVLSGSADGTVRFWQLPR